MGCVSPVFFSEDDLVAPYPLVGGSLVVYLRQVDDLSTCPDRHKSNWGELPSIESILQYQEPLLLFVVIDST